jgi:hypothetical protein
VAITACIFINSSYVFRSPEKVAIAFKPSQCVYRLIKFNTYDLTCQIFLNKELDIQGEYFPLRTPKTKSTYIVPLLKE